MVIIAHGSEGQGWGGPFEPWELHPALNHLPIAFLLGGVVLDLYAGMRGRPNLVAVATGLLVAGVLTGLLAALAGALAFITVPRHTDEAHRLMFWHMGVQAASLVLFAIPTWRRWRYAPTTPTTLGRIVLCMAAILLLIGSALGGYLVYHGGAGVAPDLLSPEVNHSDPAVTNALSTEPQHSH